MSMEESLKMRGVRTLVYAEELKWELSPEKASAYGIQCLSALDTRSAVYLATGVGAQNQEPVAVVVAAGSSRSAFSGMTEAYYRKLPVILITFGADVDYSVELKDVVVSHHVLAEKSDSFEWEDALSGELPVHIEVREKQIVNVKKTCADLNTVLRTVLDERHYLSVGQDIAFEMANFKCKVVRSGINNCPDGAMSHVLGASLAKIRQRYIGLVSEREFLHDMNALGNVNVSDSILFFVVEDHAGSVISDYARSLEFEVLDISVTHLTDVDFRMLVENGKKTVVTVFGE